MCTQLAGQSLVSDTKHNLSASSGNAILAATLDEVCIFCHTAHSTETIDQIWNHEVNLLQTYTLYDFTRISGYGTPEQPNEKSRLCLSCHDGTIAIGSVYNAPGSGLGSGITMFGDTTTIPTSSQGHLGTSLADDHPIGFQYKSGSGVGEDPFLKLPNPPWDPVDTDGILVDPNTSLGTVQCHTCHDAHDNTYAGFLRRPVETLCPTCHEKTGWDTNVAHYSEGCSGCHTPHGGGQTLLAGVEENACYGSGCHSTTLTAVGSTSGRTLDIFTQMEELNSHPTNTDVGLHTIGTGDTNDHAECGDCHDPHLAGGTPDSPVLATALKGTWGVKPTWSGGVPVPSDNSNDFTTGVTITYEIVEDNASATVDLEEYMVCLKCHSDYNSQIPAGTRSINIAEEINPAFPSTHGIAQRVETTWINASNMNPPFDDPTRKVYCSDCHSNALPGVETIATRSNARGSHGSSVIYTSPDENSNSSAMLVATIASDDIDGTPLCNVCHSRSNYWDGTLVSSRYDQHPSAKAAHQLTMGCFSCHMFENSEYLADTGGGDHRIYAHGQNKKFIWNEQRNRKAPFHDAGHGDPTLGDQTIRAFVNGYLANVDFAGSQCWSEVDAANCSHGHSGQSFGAVGP